MKRANRCSLTFLAFLCILKDGAPNVTFADSEQFGKLREDYEKTCAWERKYLRTVRMLRVIVSSLLICCTIFLFTRLSLCELCSSIRASRATKFVAEGGSLRLSCEVQHCGIPDWTGGWVFQELDTVGFTSLIPSERIEMSSSSSTANSTHLILHIHSINQSDAGAYKCMISWPQNIISSGHVTYVNVTAAADSSGRSLSHRVLLCLGALMCFPVVLGFVWCLTRDHHHHHDHPPPPVPPRTRTSYAARVKLKKELVYAEVAMNDSRRQNDHPKQASEPTVYSSVHFS